MALASDRNQAPAQAEVHRGVGVVDAIEIKPSHGLPHASGVAAVLDAFPAVAPRDYVGRTVHIRTPAGSELTAKVGDVRDHRTTISLFFEGLTRSDVPIGSRLEFEAE